MFVNVKMDNDSNILTIESLILQMQHLDYMRNYSDKNQGVVKSWIAAPNILQVALDEQANGTKIIDYDDWASLLNSTLEEDIDCTDERDPQFDSIATFAKESI